MGNKLVLEGDFTILEEICPKYFPDVIEWRNNKENNRFLNQPFELTMELEEKWYNTVYLPDSTQGFLIMLDKAKRIPFGTLGWTHYSKEKHICIGERFLVGNREYRGSVQMLEGCLMMSDYLYTKQDVKTMYCHIADDNKHVISFNKKMGFVVNNGDVVFPDNLLVNGLKQKEYVRDINQYNKAREKIKKLMAQTACYFM